jgi:uncharacterized protein (TIGR00255 family)
MIKSMTGYGKATNLHEGKKVSVEIKTLNSKGLDLYVKLPQEYKSLEMEIRKSITQVLDRGKIEVSISVENEESAVANHINLPLAKAYIQELSLLAKESGLANQDILATVIRLPEVLSAPAHTISESEVAFVNNLVAEAATATDHFRIQEGVPLHKDMQQQIAAIRDLLAQVPPFEQERMVQVKERIRKSLAELKESIDENRFEQELIFYLEKLDISEEKQRLTNHLNYFDETLQAGSPIGKKLGFIAQEIGREINTLGSKAQHIELQKIVVHMKDHLEKIKEQVLNTL